MRILVAEDDATTRRLLEVLLRQWGYDPLVLENGTAAWEALTAAGGPSLALLDWQLPGMDGTEICRRSRASVTGRPLYLLLLTSRDDTQDVVEGLSAGADEYLTKPVAPAELRARLRAAERVLRLEDSLRERVRDLEAALANVKTLEALLPICSYCKRMRDDGQYWHQVEHYIAQHTHTQFSHGVCPDCYARHVQPQLDAIT